LTTVFPVFAGGSIQAGVGQHQALHRLSTDDVRFDDFVNIGLGDVSVPYGIGIDHDIRAMLALIETAGFVSTDLSLESAISQFLFEQFLQLCLAVRIAASSRISGRALIAAYEDVFFELRHEVWFTASKFAYSKSPPKVLL
jgi:hypothetical protein